MSTQSSAATSAHDLFSVRGKTAVVTGGSRGIGFMIAKGLVEAGAHVVISARKAEACQQASVELNEFAERAGAGSEAEPGRCEAIPADLSTEAGTQSLAVAVRERFGELNLLVNNAGVSWGAPVEEFPELGWDKVLNTNVRGVFSLTVALLPELRKAVRAGDPARVINIGSIDGLRVPSMENYSYSASKAALHMLTRHLAKRLASDQITVNAIAPGPFPSKMTAFFLGTEEQREAVGQEVPLGRVGQGDDIAGTTIFLASRAGAYLTGTVIPLDGGITGLNPNTI
ncbi:MAG TPA: SDR family oxidoreductase [Kineosporiaceae bacterium]|nr:SDR family oxidoreductase [Kineosporiaceae bacterium]